MNRSLTALFAALEALLVIGIGIGIPLVPLTFIWAFQYGLQLDWLAFWRASVDIWLIGSGVDVTLTLDPVTVLLVGFEGAGTPFVITIAALGFSLLTALMGIRAGRRITETPHRMLGLGTALGTFAILSLAVTLTAVHRFAEPSLWQGLVLPTAVFGVGLLIGSEVTRRRLAPTRQDDRQGIIGRWWSEVPALARIILAQSLRGGTAAAMIVIGVGAVATAVMIVVGYGRIIALYEGVHAGVLGGIALTLAQLAFLPNLVIWAAAWLIGPGFAVGTGSSVGPLATSLGPVPAVPLFGALPTGDLPLGFLGILVPVLAGFVAGYFVYPTLERGLAKRMTLPWLLSAGAGIGVAGGLLLGVLSWLSSGAAGPGRLAEVGPHPLLIIGFATLEFAVPAMLGLIARRQRASV